MSAHADEFPTRPEAVAPSAWWSTHLLQRCLAEVVGTFAIVFTGCGAVVVNQTSGGAVTHVGISLVFGLVVMVMVYATGHVSGAHFNPAVTIAFASIRRFPWREVPAYTAAQCAGALLASLTLLGMFGPVAQLGATLPAGDPLQSVLMEIALTFLLMFVVAGVATDGRAIGHMAGVAVGALVTVAAFVGGPVSGASLNPARSLGPALAIGCFDSLWIYLLAPVVGTVAGAWISPPCEAADAHLRQQVGGGSAASRNGRPEETVG